MRNTVYHVVSEACANVDRTAGIRLFCWISDPVNRLKVITGASVENGKQAVNKPGANVMSIRQKNQLTSNIYTFEFVILKKNLQISVYKNGADSVKPKE